MPGCSPFVVGCQYIWSNTTYNKWFHPFWFWLGCRELKLNHRANNWTRWGPSLWHIGAIWGHWGQSLVTLPRLVWQLLQFTSLRRCCRSSCTGIELECNWKSANLSQLRYSLGRFVLCLYSYIACKVFAISTWLKLDFLLIKYSFISFNCCEVFRYAIPLEGFFYIRRSQIRFSWLHGNMTRIGFPSQMGFHAFYSFNYCNVFKYSILLEGFYFYMFIKYMLLVRFSWYPLE